MQKTGGILNSMFANIQLECLRLPARNLMFHEVIVPLSY